MSNVAVIFAGGTGKRMNTRSRPKQFLELHGKPIIVYTVEAFQNHPDIDGIIIVILEAYIDYCEKLVRQYDLKKVRAIVAGGDSAIASQRNGLKKAMELYPEDTVVLIHDGVRPLIDDNTISKDIEIVKEHGSAITVTPAIETITLKNSKGEIDRIIERSNVELARAPQCFFLRDIMAAHEKALADDIEFIDSASMMHHYGFPLFTVEGLPENIKITTPNDFYMFRALVDARENSQIFGI